MIRIGLFNIYAPVQYKEKKECWGSISDTIEAYNPSNIVLAGDMNMVLNSNEKKGGFYGNDTQRNQIMEIIRQNDLIDIKPKKGKYTWSNKRVGTNHIAARLDRFLIQGNILSEVKLIHSSLLPNLTSDHKPIMLTLEDEEDLSPIPFRFNPLWENEPSFEEIVKEAWNKPVKGSPGFVWEGKLMNTKLALKEWSKKSLKDYSRKRK